LTCSRSVDHVLFSIGSHCRLLFLSDIRQSWRARSVPGHRCRRKYQKANGLEDLSVVKSTVRSDTLSPSREDVPLTLRLVALSGPLAGTVFALDAEAVTF